MTGMRRAAQARMQRVIERAKVKRAVTAPALVQLLDRGRIARWVKAQIVNYPPGRCLGCRRPIVFGAKWTEVVNDNARARFHVACLPVWKLQQEAAARRALGMKEAPKC